MKLSSRKQLLKEAEDVLRQIRNENKQNLNEGLLYSIWSKIADKLPFAAGTIGVLMAGLGRSGNASEYPGLSLFLFAAIAAAGAGMGIDALLKRYFQNRFFDKELQPIIDEMMRAVSQDKPLYNHAINIKKINDEIRKIEADHASVKKGSRGAPDIRKELNKKKAELELQVYEINKKIKARINTVMNKYGGNEKFVKAMFNIDPYSYAGELSPDYYKRIVKDRIAGAIYVSDAEIDSIKKDAKKMEESIKKRHDLL